MTEPVPEALQAWQRLHPLSPIVRGGRALVLLLLIAITDSLDGNRSNTALVIYAVVVVLVVLGGFISWAVTRWRIEGGDLRIETGLLRRDSQRYPLRQIQAIDVVETGLARVLKLAELRLRMAGGSSKGRLACLPQAEAKQLREELLQLSQNPTQQAPSPMTEPVPFTPAGALMPILEVPTGRLVASMLLSARTILIVLYLAGASVGAVLSSTGTAGALGSAAAVTFGVGTDMWRRFNGSYRMTIRSTGRGLDLTSGLVQQTNEVLPPGRVQALRVVEPLLWRPAGWCRVEASVAGKAARSDNQAESSSRRLLLPVGTYAEAYQILGLLLPDLMVTLTKPPPRARWKSPLSYHRLAVGWNNSCVVTRSGRLRRVSHWVPLDKVQSIRWTQGPVQRVLRLATVHLDTAGARMKAAMHDRDVVEADTQLQTLPDACAAARRAAVIRR